MSMLALPGILQQQGAGGGAFDALSASYGSPFHAFWAEDPNNVQSDDTDATTIANDGSNGTVATRRSTTSPKYRTSVSALNNRAAWQFTASSSGVYEVDETSTAAATQPTSHIVVIEFTDTSFGSSGHFVDGDPSDVAFRNIMRHTGSAQLLNAGTSQTQGTLGTGAYLIVAVFNGASSVLRINGSAVTVSGTVGTGTIDGLILMGSRTATVSSINGHLAFYRQDHNLDVTGESWFSGFESDCTSHYGI